MMLYLELDRKEKHEMVNAFNENCDKHMFLIMIYMVISAGLNLQQYFRNVHFDIRRPRSDYCRADSQYCLSDVA